MRNTIYAFLTSVIIFSTVHAQVVIGGPQSGVLETDHYIVLDSLYIDEGRGLIIQPGTLIEFQGDFSFVVNGYLSAVGTPDSMIIFRHDPAHTPFWKGIEIRENADDTSILSYCQISGSDECGVAVIGSNPTITHCEFFDNINTMYRGGGIFCYQFASPTITDCYIHDNYGVLDAGGIYCADSSNATISNCLLVNNESDFGGAIYSNYSDPVITNCVMIDNISTYYGGGIYFFGTHATVTGCTFIGNYAENGGGGIHLRNDSAVISKCTIVGNDGNAGGGGLYAFDRGDFEMANTIIYGNTNGGVHIGNVWSANVHHNNIYGNDEDITGEPPEGFGVLSQVNVNGDSCDIFNNILADPMFYDYENDDLNLTPPSPCINAGDANAQQDPDGSIIDIGVAVYPGYPSELNFGVEQIQLFTYGFETDSVYIAIENSSEGWGIIDSIRFSDPSDSLVIAEDFYPYIEPDGTEIVKLYWTPTTTDTMFNQVLFYHNDEIIENPYIIELVGIVINAVKDLNNEIPNQFNLYQNYPNPFNAVTNIGFDLPVGSNVKLELINVLGQSVKTILENEYPAGSHTLSVSLQDYPTGIYYCRLQTDSQSKTVRIAYIK